MLVYKAVKLNRIENDPHSYISHAYPILAPELIVKYEIGKWTSNIFPVFVFTTLAQAAYFIRLYGNAWNSVILECHADEDDISFLYATTVGNDYTKFEKALRFWESVERIPFSKELVNDPRYLVVVNIIKPLRVVSLSEADRC